MKSKAESNFSRTKKKPRFFQFTPVNETGASFILNKLTKNVVPPAAIHSAVGIILNGCQHF